MPGRTPDTAGLRVAGTIYCCSTAPFMCLSVRRSGRPGQGMLWLTDGDHLRNDALTKGCVAGERHVRDHR
jgi:hypothetical protein